MSGEPRPHAVIVAGPNGAGKSTLAPRLLAQEFGIQIAHGEGDRVVDIRDAAAWNVLQRQAGSERV